MRLFIASALCIGLLSLSGLAQAHTPLFSCYDNGDGTIACEGGFSDGSSAAGVAVHIFDASGKSIAETKLDEYSEVNFKKPEGEYRVQFDAGEGHRIDVSGKDIVE